MGGAHEAARRDVSKPGAKRLQKLRSRQRRQRQIHRRKQWLGREGTKLEVPHAPEIIDPHGLTGLIWAISLGY